MRMTMRSYLLCAVALLLLPTAILAQNVGTATITGVVKDASGATIPGATVEAASPALIEKSRSAVTDGAGAYRIINLQPGTYSVTFTAAGFTVVRHEGLVLVAGFDATENAELQVGQVSQTVTVESTAPVVDTESAAQSRVFALDETQNLPIGMTVKAYATLIPGMVYNGGAFQQDVGGNKSEINQNFMIHGGAANDFEQLRDGLFFGTYVAAGNWMTSLNPATVNNTEVQIGSQPAEFSSGGVVINVVEREGGNNFHGTVIGAWTDSTLESNNISPALQARSASLSLIRRRFDIGGGVGGPIIKDKLWFFFSERAWQTATNFSNSYFNATPNTLFYTPNTSQPAYEDNHYHAPRLRLTYQASAKDKISAMYGIEFNCNCPVTPSTAILEAPQAYIGVVYRPNWQTELTWTHTFNSHLLLEAGSVVIAGQINYSKMFPSGDATNAVTNTTEGVVYGNIGYGYALGELNAPTAGGAEGTNKYGETNQRAAVTYVTGSHTLKTGVQSLYAWTTTYAYAPPETNDTSYTFVGPLASGTPVSISEYALPLQTKGRQRTLAWYVQDQWRILKRLTLSPGVRYEHLDGSAPATNMPAGYWVPARSFPAVSGIPIWNDWLPRIGAAYDLFGNGKTAIKAFFGRFVLFSPISAITAPNSPANLMTGFATRNWNDTLHNYTPFGPGAIMGPISNSSFGTVNQTTFYADDVLHGNRPYNWQETVDIEQQLWHDASLKVGYFRRTYGNFYETQNTAVTPANYSPYCITAGSNAALPGGGGNQICGLYDINPAQFGLSHNVVDLAKHIGNQSDVFNGVDVTFRARFHGGAFVQAGMATGSEVTDVCWANNLPNVLTSTMTATIATPRTQAFCHISPPWSDNTQFKAAVIYPLPWWKLQVSGNYQNIGPINTTASQSISNSAIFPSLGRNLAACGTSTSCNATVTANIVLPNTYYREPRDQQLDLRFSRAFTLRHEMTLQANIDLYNVFNGSAVEIINTTVGPSYNQVLGLLAPRVLRFGFNFNF